MTVDPRVSWIHAIRVGVLVTPLVISTHSSIILQSTPTTGFRFQLFSHPSYIPGTWIFRVSCQTIYICWKIRSRWRSEGWRGSRGRTLQILQTTKGERRKLFKSLENYMFYEKHVFCRIHGPGNFVYCFGINYRVSAIELRSFHDSSSMRSSSFHYSNQKRKKPSSFSKWEIHRSWKPFIRPSIVIFQLFES